MYSATQSGDSTTDVSCPTGRVLPQRKTSERGARRGKRGPKGVHRTEDCFGEPELHRLKGELLSAMSPDNHTEVEVCFQKAFDVSRRQNAKSFELRAAMSLSRLRQKQGKMAEARELLAGVYGWFTEGFESRDLEEARAMLDQPV